MVFVPREPLDHDDLRAFLAVVAHGNFTHAARALRAPKSSVSKRVAALEARVGVALLARTTRTVTVTAAGRALADALGPALEAIERAVDRTGLDAAEARGRVRVTAPVVFGDELLAPLVAPFLARYPEVQVDLWLTDRRVDLVAEGVDVAIRAGPMVDSALVVRRLGPAASCLVASPRYLAERGAPRRFADLAAHRWCLFSATGVAPTTVALSGPRGPAALAPRVALTSTSQIALRRCLVDGAGLGLLPWYLARDPVARGALAEVLPSYRGPVGELQLLTVAGRATGATRAFVAAVTEAFRDARPWVR
jgi:DNA-binding transcriptional LysR family regulator